MSRKRKRGRRGRRPRARQRRSAAPADAGPPPEFDYDWALGQADELLARNGIEAQPDNWQAVTLQWVAGTARDRQALAGYIEAHGIELGVAWARAMLRLEVFFQAEDHLAIVYHYDRALADYARCALVEMYVGAEIARHGADWWRARPLFLYAVERLPGYARPRYELGFLHHLLGDLAGALRWFDEAEALLHEEDQGFEAARLYYNRGMVRLMHTGDRDAAVADLAQAVGHDPAYGQARVTLDALRRGEVRWLPW